jgi:hypothetical protein
MTVIENADRVEPHSGALDDLGNGPARDVDVDDERENGWQFANKPDSLSVDFGFVDSF